MIVQQILNIKGRDVVAAAISSTIKEAAALLAERRIGAIPICEGDKLVGMLSERDIIRGIAIRGAKVLGESVDTLMTKSVHTCSPTTTMDDLMSLMTDRKIRHVPVLDEQKMVGMISIGDVVKEKIRESENEAEALKSYIASA